jgi:hypothetical protein
MRTIWLQPRHCCSLKPPVHPRRPLKSVQYTPSNKQRKYQSRPHPPRLGTLESRSLDCRASRNAGRRSGSNSECSVRWEEAGRARSARFVPSFPLFPSFSDHSPHSRLSYASHPRFWNAFSDKALPSSPYRTSSSAKRSFHILSAPFIKRLKSINRVPLHVCAAPWQYNNIS